MGKAHSNGSADARQPNRLRVLLSLFLLASTLGAAITPALVAPAQAADGLPPKVYPISVAPVGERISLRPTFSAMFDEPVQPSTIVWTARSSSGATFTGPVTWFASTKTAQMTPTGTLAPATTYAVSLSAADLAGNAMAPDSWSFTVGACPCSFWAGNPTPAVTDLNGGGPIDLGLRFSSQVDGYVTGVRFYKGPHNTGTHTGSLWAGNRTLLATATFTDESATGWQVVRFAAPVPVQARGGYVVSYYAPDGGYAYNPAFFPTGWPAPPVASGPLEAPYSAVTGTAGVYRYGPSGFPELSYNGTNYWVDVIFTTTP